MKLAIIDIGSNSVRLLLATYENNEWRYEPKQLWTTRLGQRNTMVPCEMNPWKHPIKPLRIYKK